MAIFRFCASPRQIRDFYFLRIDALVLRFMMGAPLRKHIWKMGSQSPAPPFY